MTKTALTALAPFSRFALGFDRLFDEFDNFSQTSYPPYNILRDGKDGYIIEIAVAGFSEDDLAIELNQGVLQVSNSHSETEKGQYLHKGIAMRDFRLQFRLAENIQVEGASLLNGLLTIRLANVSPEPNVKRIPIGGPAT